MLFPALSHLAGGWTGNLLLRFLLRHHPGIEQPAYGAMESSLPAGINL